VTVGPARLSHAALPAGSTNDGRGSRHTLRVLVSQPPADLEEVRFAFRLGWGLAELRGRYRPDRFELPVPPDEGSAFRRPEHELPLASERSPYEVRIEVFEALKGLSGALKLNPAHRDYVQAEIKKMNQKGANRTVIWRALANRFYLWDAYIQDTLVVPASQAAAYQLGRALSETYWALYPERAANEMGSWASLLGTTRCHTILRLTARLSPYLGPLIKSAIEGPLEEWSKFAAVEQGKDDQTLLCLYRQGLLWRDVVRGERLPEDLVSDATTPAPKTEDVWGALGIYRQALEALKWPLLLAVAFSALLTAGAALLASGASHPGWATAISILGLLGLTSASLYAQAKAKLVSLFEAVRLQIDTEKARRAANLCPQRG
jgi:hypothetical protein